MYRRAIRKNERLEKVQHASCFSSPVLGGFVKFANVLRTGHECGQQMSL